MKNVGSMDRIARIVIGLGLVAYAVFGGPAWAWVGVIPLPTALIGRCPIYTLFGVRTCPLRDAG